MIAYSLIQSQLFTPTITSYINEEGKGENSHVNDVCQLILESTSEIANQSS